MGTDIHGFWEAKTPDGHWLAFRKINDSRSYTWFGITANVRYGGTDCETAGRGIPTSPSAAWNCYIRQWGNGLYGHTYLTLGEVAKANHRFIKECRKSDPTYGDIDYEVLPTLEEEITMLYLSGMNGPDEVIVPYRWTGTLADILGESGLDDNVRMVIAFDN